MKVSQAEPVEVIAKHVDAGIKRTQQGTHALCMEVSHTISIPKTLCNTL